MKAHRQVNSIAAGSMADIAFLLLIFFLVTTTILNEKGIMIKLPPWDPEPTSTSIHERNVLNIYLNANNQLMAEEEVLEISLLKDFIKSFINNLDHSDQRPDIPSDAIISLKNDRATAYSEYIAVYDAIVSAYRDLQNEKSQQLFGRPMDGCTNYEKQQVKKIIPMVISEMEVTDLANNGDHKL